MKSAYLKWCMYFVSLVLFGIFFFLSKRNLDRWMLLLRNRSVWYAVKRTKQHILLHFHACKCGMLSTLLNIISDVFELLRGLVWFMGDFIGLNTSVVSRVYNYVISEMRLIRLQCARKLTYRFLFLFDISLTICARSHFTHLSSLFSIVLLSVSMEWIEKSHTFLCRMTMSCFHCIMILFLSTHDPPNRINHSDLSSFPI